MDMVMNKRHEVRSKDASPKTQRTKPSSLKHAEPGILRKRKARVELTWPSGRPNSVVELKGQGLKNIQTLMKDFDLPFGAAFQLQLNLAFMDDGLFATKRSFLAAIRRIEVKFGVPVDRSKLPDFRPPKTKKQFQEALELDREARAEVRRMKRRASAKKVIEPKRTGVMPTSLKPKTRT